MSPRNGGIRAADDRSSPLSVAVLNTDDFDLRCMYPLTVKEICEVTQGTASGNADLSAIIDGCVIDSRDAQHGDAFFALSGRKTHGIRFAHAAIESGADIVLVDESLEERCECPHVTVPDVEIALAQLAQNNRRRSDALVIGITGSVGKTTTRTAIASVLQQVHTGIQSPRNFNNHLGVPLSLLELQEGDEFAAIEIGASAPNEIAILSSIAEPEMAVVTSVGPAHLQGFGSVQAVQREKQQLVQSLNADGTAFLNVDDRFVAQMVDVAPGQVVTFGTSAEAMVRAEEIRPEDDHLCVVVDGIELRAPYCGRHNATSMLAAIAVGLEVGLSVDDIQAGLAAIRPVAGRCEVQSLGAWTLIDDTYNSNPSSVAAAIRAVEDYRSCSRRVLALGDMLDLGEQSADLHFGIGAALAGSKIDHIAVTGQHSEHLIDGFLSSGGHVSRISQFKSLRLMASMLGCILSDDDVLLVKGSRGAEMERLISRLQKSLLDDELPQRQAA